MRRAEIEKTLPKVYEDEDVEVVIAPSEDEVREYILEMLKEGPKDIKEIHSVLYNLASDERIRRILYDLKYKGVIEEDKKTKKFYLRKN